MAVFIHMNADGYTLWSAEVEYLQKTKVGKRGSWFT